MYNDKDRNLIDRLKSEFHSLSVPDLKNEIIANYQNKKQNIDKPKRFARVKWRPVFAASLFATIVIGLFIGFLLLSPATTYQITEDKDIMAFEAISAVAVITKNDNNEDLPLAALPLTNPALPNINEDVEVFHKYINLIEQILNIKDKFSITSGHDSDMNYEHNDLIEITTVFNDTIVYQLSYDLIGTKNDWEAAGIIDYYEDTFPFEAKKKNNQGISLSLYIDDDNQIEIKQQHRNKQDIFNLNIKEKNEESAAAFSFYKKLSRIEIDIEINDKRFRCYRSNKNIKVEAKHYNAKVEIEVSKENGKYKYQNNKNNDIIHKNKPNHQGGRWSR